MQQLFLKGFSGDVAAAQARASMVAGEGVTNIRTIAAFNAEDRVLKLFEHELEAPMKRGFLRGQVYMPLQFDHAAEVKNSSCSSFLEPNSISSPPLEVSQISRK